MNKLVRKLKDGIRKAYAQHEHNRNMREWEKLVRKREADRKHRNKAENIL